MFQACKVSASMQLCPPPFYTMSKFFGREPKPLPPAARLSRWIGLANNGGVFLAAVEKDACKLWLTYDSVSPTNHGWSILYKQVWFAHHDADKQTFKTAYRPKTTSKAMNGGVIIVQPASGSQFLLVDGIYVHSFRLPAGVSVDFVWGMIGNSAVPFAALRLTDGSWVTAEPLPMHKPKIRHYPKHTSPQLDLRQVTDDKTQGKSLAVTKVWEFGGDLAPDKPEVFQRPHIWVNPVSASTFKTLRCASSSRTRSASAPRSKKAPRRASTTTKSTKSRKASAASRRSAKALSRRR